MNPHDGPLRSGAKSPPERDPLVIVWLTGSLRTHEAADSSPLAAHRYDRQVIRHEHIAVVVRAYIVEQRRARTAKD